jgi:hypothetical protein
MAQNTDVGPYLEAGPLHQPSDTQVRSGYPIWTLISVWAARGQSDEAVIQEYALDPAEWAAAKAYYAAHKDVIDARRTLNDEPGDMPPEGILLEDLLARPPVPSDKTQA